MNARALVVTVTGLLLSACGTSTPDPAVTGGSRSTERPSDVSFAVHGPLVTSAGSPSSANEALVSGTLSYERGCVLLGGMPAVWPEGTTWDSDGHRLILTDGTAVEQGSPLYGSGGYLDVRAGRLDPLDENVAAALRPCLGDSREVAVFNVGLAVTTEPPQQTRSDCTAQVRLQGRLYRGYGYTDREGIRFAVADQADCHDVGDDAEGAVFAAAPPQVTVWSFPGYAPERVLGVRFDQDSFAVFIADSVSPADLDRIVADLSQPPQ